MIIAADAHRAVIAGGAVTCKVDFDGGLCVIAARQIPA